MQVLNDFSTSVRKAFEEIDPEWESYPGLVVCGTHSPNNIPEFLDIIKVARENRTPYLGICFGLQLMAIEYARNIIGIKDAISEEFGLGGTPVVHKLPNLRVGIIQVGWEEAPEEKPKNIEGILRLHKLTEPRYESHWHNYAVDPGIAKAMERDGYRTVFTDGILEYAGKENMLGVQFHPEYGSSKDDQHPLLVRFIQSCKKK